MAPGAAGLAPYKARYQVSYRGISGGELETSLHRGTAQGQWLYESRAFPNLLARVAVSPDARQRSTMDVAQGTVRPQSLVFDDGSDSGVKDVRMTFDWRQGRVRGESKGKPFDVAVQPGTQDSTSVQVAMLLELVAGHEPKSFRIQNGARLEEYRYWPEGQRHRGHAFRKVRDRDLGEPARWLETREPRLARAESRLRSRAGHPVQQGPAGRADEAGGAGAVAEGGSGKRSGKRLVISG